MSLVTPSPVPLFGGQLPDPADRGTYGARGRLVWEYETGELVPALNVLASQTFENAEFASQMAAQAASVAGFLGPWEDQAGAASQPASVEHEGLFYVLMADVADITAHEPGVSIVWALFDGSSTAESTTFDNTGTDLAATQVQAAIVEMLGVLALKVGRTSPTGSVRPGSRTTGQREGTPQIGDRAWNPDLNGGRGAEEVWNGTAWEPDGWVVSAPVASTSGAQIDFNGIPAWANEVRIFVRGLSTNGSNNGLFQLGTSVGFESTGYDSSGDGVAVTSGFLLFISSPNNGINGQAVFTRGQGATWDYLFSGAGSGSGIGRNSSGHKTMSGAVTRIRLTTAGGVNAFDAGSVHIAWRK